VGARFFAHVHTGSEAHPASCTMGTGSFPGVNRPGRGADYPPASSAEVKKEKSYTSTHTQGYFRPAKGQLYLALCINEYVDTSNYPSNTTIYPPPPIAQQPLVIQDLLIIESSRSHSDTPHSVGIIWRSDQSDIETSTCQHTTLTRDRHPCPDGIRTRSSSKRAAADPRLRPRGPWDRLTQN
jgi:hypothetical protein